MKNQSISRRNLLTRAATGAAGLALAARTTSARTSTAGAAGDASLRWGIIGTGGWRVAGAAEQRPRERLGEQLVNSPTRFPVLRRLGRRQQWRPGRRLGLRLRRLRSRLGFRLWIGFSPHIAPIMNSHDAPQWPRRRPEQADAWRSTCAGKRCLRPCPCPASGPSN